MSVFRKALEMRANSSRPYLRFNELWVAKPNRNWAEHLLHTLGLPVVSLGALQWVEATNVF